ncbi:hypothetical protein ACFSJW_02605 [Flavobacterium artemisiae]|uniref:Addiction module component n=1 Tax=Flavobacterium artemisiae TaxID=2126556 RepID=A0ABW4HLA7_9FLAO
MDSRKIEQELKKIWIEIPTANSEKTKLNEWEKLRSKLFSSNDKTT